MIRLAALVAAVLLALAMSGVRAEVADGDRAAIRTIITGQIEAFRRDDGDAAYAYAAPAIRDFFPTAVIFMDMVRKGYQPVYRPQAFTFGPIVESPFGLKQKVYLTGPDGRGYVAEYTMQRQPDGTWKINGCVILKDDSPSI